jgi:hypothetical protein
MKAACQDFIDWPQHWHLKNVESAFLCKLSKKNSLFGVQHPAFTLACFKEPEDLLSSMKRLQR